MAALTTAVRCKAAQNYWLVAGGRFELYSAYPRGPRQLSDGGTGGRASDADPAAARDTREIRFLDGSYLMYILVSTCLAQEVTTHGKEADPHGSTVGK